MLYKNLAKFYEEVSSTTKRLEKIKILSKFLKEISELDKEVLYLLLGDIYPEYDERRIGISSQLAIKSIELSVGIEKEQVVKEWKSIGDLGKVAEKLKENKRQSTLQSHTLTTEKVLNNLRKLPELEGKGTIGKKISLITELLTSASPLEAKYLIRTLIGDLIIGLKESTIRESMAVAFFPEEKKKESAEKIQQAIDKSNDISLVFEIAKKGKINALEKISLEVGKPIKAMLAQKIKTISEGFKALGVPCAVEYKYDGFRLIIHKKGKEIKLFTRRLENVTNQFPEVVDYLKRYVKGDSFILDSEAVGYNKKTGEYQPFQAISQRIRRKYNIEKIQKEMPVEINVFDVLYFNGKSMLDEPFKKRTEMIRKIVKNQKYKIVSSKQIITGDEKNAEDFYKKALKDNQEGVMMKSLDAKYKPGSRVGFMLKIKPEERDMDLVITGAEYGTGKRSGWMSSFIISCRDSKTKKYLEIGKVGTGIKEKATEKSDSNISFNELTKKLMPLIVKEKGKTVEIKPKIVVSVTYQEIQKSPNYNSGFALRFPRFTALRNDKSLSEISSLKEVEEDYENQKRNYKYG
ncbi:DNA ligase [Candidatus Pacearchaeota archaeon CG10_big_fil_rev_8_21_14_0_10_34_12]|nr:MAG: DNA ligase [Candidatus Pacearchaeota archaeon CG10_big_fil_rev_8_21_14_0_10_34_12]